MAWHQSGDKPLSEPIMVKFTDAWLSHNELNKFPNIPIQENAFENIICKMLTIFFRSHCVNTYSLRQNGHHFANDIFKYIFLK